MGVKNKQIDTYIAKSANFAKPILTHIRQLIHKACPEVIEELKWGHPSFTYHGILCGIAAFKGHCAFGFWKHALLAETEKSFSPSEQKAMGQFGRITSIKDLPSATTLTALIKRASELNAGGVKVPAKARPRASRPKTVVVPPVLVAAFRKNKKAKAGFEALSPSHKREYIDWITGAKQEETRARRLATALEWMAEGKSQNWRYERK
jgi:uncharacterized protein YdeI (YjbR/CyaY-like superfamily)